MYKKLINQKSLTRDERKELKELYKKPNSEKGEMPVFQTYKPMRQQADVLFLPTAKFGFKYLLVVVDNYTRKFDAQPLKLKDSEAIVKALKKIYNRDIIQKPKMIEFDAGKEFKGATREYLEDEDIKYRYAMTARHRQMALVESKNFLIGKVINYMLNVNEIKKNKTSKDWYQSDAKFRNLVEKINDSLTYKPPNDNDDSLNDNIIVTKNNYKLLEKGTEVRVTLNYPVDVAYGERQSGSFRAGDIRWSRTVHTIEWIVLHPNNPPLYKVSGENVLRTRQQLQVIKA
jgi:hypothetical protein